MARLDIRLFGSFQVILDGVPFSGFYSDKVRALLAYLAMEGGRPHRREKLAGLLWPDFLERSARANLRRALVDLRQVIGDHQADPPFLHITRQTIQFNQHSDTWLDVAAFLAAVTPVGGRSPDIAQLEEAVTWYEGAFMEGFSIPDSAAFEEWTLITRESLQRELLVALQRLVDHCLEPGRYEQALLYARRQVELEPYREKGQQQLMRLLAWSGRRSEALAQYEVFRQLMAKDLATEPASDTKALFARIRDGELIGDVTELRQRTVRGYELKERLGSGSFGVVYRAYQPVVERDVAIKIIRPQFANHPDFIRRFEAEAQLVARLEHPHIVPLYDYWREPGGAFLVMRWLRGDNLQQALQRGPWNLTPALRLVRQVAAALHVAHGRGIIHRDVKPANILLDDAGNAYLSDFGVATFVGPLGMPGQPLPAAESDDPSGSLGYLSPESIQQGPVTAATDIYSLGVVMYELLTGHHPFPDVALAALLNKHVNEPLPSVQDLRPELPAAVDAVIQRATAKMPHERHPNVMAMATAFKQAARGVDVIEVIPEADLVNPYKGLRPFQEADAADFFGREALVDQLLARMKEDGAGGRFLALVGPSGSGKSSAIKAGLLPALRQGALPGSQDWFIAQMMPGSHPLDELEIALLRIAASQPAGLMEQLRRDEQGLVRAARLALPDEDGDLFLVIDQFEELFTPAADPDESARLLHHLVAAATEPRSPVRILISLRADFYDRPLMHKEFSRLMRARTEVVVPMDAEEMSQAICEPAVPVGVHVETELMTTMVADIGEQPGTLPLLQYALTELFEHRDGQHLTLAAYHEMGGVLGALGRRAEEIYQSLDKPGQDMTRQLFLRLVTLGEGIEDTRRRVLRSELEALKTEAGAAIDDARFGIEDSPLGPIFDALGRYRLLTFDRDPATRGPTVEVAHEALLREWDRLRGWLDESRHGIRMQRLLAGAAAEWEATNREVGFLLRGSRLGQFEGWAAETDVALTQDEQAFLDASLAERRTRQLAEVERQAREATLERRARNFLRTLAGVLLIATLGALGLMGFAFNERDNAQIANATGDANLTTAVAAQATSDANQLVAIANAATATVAQGDALNQADLAATRATEADDAAAEAQDQRAIAQEQRDIAEQEARAALEAHSLSLSVHAQQALDDLDSGTALALALAASRIEDPPKEVIDVLKLASFAPGARRQFSLRDPDGETVTIWSFAVSPDGHSAMAGLLRGDILLLDIESGEILRTFTGHTNGVVNVTFSPDGATALSGGCDTEVILWKVATGEELGRFSGHSGCVQALNFSPDGRRLVSGAYASGDPWIPGELFLWDVESGEEIHRFEGGHTYGVCAAVFSPDGGTILSGDFSRGGVGGEYGSPLILWDVESGEIIHRFPAPNDPSLDVAFNPNGGTVLSATVNRLYLWDLASGEELRMFEGHKGTVEDVAFSPDGRSVISSDSFESILWDLASGEPISRFVQAGVSFVTFRPDGRTAISCSVDGSLVWWDLFSANEVRRFEGHEGGIADVTFTPDGRQFLSAGGSDFRFSVPGIDNNLRLWDVETGEQLQLFEGHTDILLDVKVSPNGRQALSTSIDGTMRLWDLENGTEVRRFEYPHLIANISIHPDGRRALTATTEPSLLLWDLETGEILRYFIGHSDLAVAVAFSPDPKRALSGGADGTLILWDVETGTQIRRLWFEYNIMTSVVFSPDGRLAISGAVGGQVVVWDVETGEILRVFTELESGVDANMVDLGPDGRTVVSSNWEGTVFVWDLQTGDVLHHFTSRDPLPAYPAFSPDGRFLLIGSQDRTITLWRLESIDLNGLRQWIETNRIVRELTCAERAQYGIEPLCEEVVEALPVPVPVPATDALEVPHRPTHSAQIGDNRGEIALGDFDIWLYEGQADEEVTIRLIADNPANDIPPDERIERGLLDTQLFIISPDGSLLGANDDTAESNTNSLIEGLTLPGDGSYLIQARSYGDRTTGTYTLVIESTMP